MGKVKTIIICAAALCCPIFICSGSAAGNALRNSAYVSAGVKPYDHNSSGQPSGTSVSSSGSTSLPLSSQLSSPGASSLPPVSSDKLSPESSPGTSSTSTAVQASLSAVTSSAGGDEPAGVTRGMIITKNRSVRTDDVDFSKFTNKSGKIYRYSYDRGVGQQYIDLISGAQVHNCTDKDSNDLLAASGELPDIQIEDSSKPTVLIYHTHTTESYMPEGDRYDPNYPDRSIDSTRNMVAVGDAICEALAERGISVVHDCEVHDNPEYVGAYNRSAETILRNLKEYPSIKIVLDIHRDGISNPNGSLVAPVCEVNGKNAAQFMIISGCDGEKFAIPHYMENFRLACLLQNTSEKLYPNLARSVLFDYRDYNQSLFAGTLLIEVGSHGNSLEESVYTGELLGEIIAEAIGQLKVNS